MRWSVAALGSGLSSLQWSPPAQRPQPRHLRKYVTPRDVGIPSNSANAQVLFEGSPDAYIFVQAVVEPRPLVDSEHAPTQRAQRVPQALQVEQHPALPCPQKVAGVQIPVKRTRIVQPRHERRQSGDARRIAAPRIQHRPPWDELACQPADRTRTAQRRQRPRSGSLWERQPESRGAPCCRCTQPRAREPAIAVALHDHVAPAPHATRLVLDALRIRSRLRPADQPSAKLAASRRPHLTRAVPSGPTAVHGTQRTPP